MADEVIEIAHQHRLLHLGRSCTSAVTETLANPPDDQVVPTSQMAGYLGTPLPKKSGIRDGSVVALIDPPAEFAKTLGQLPSRARLALGQQPEADLTIWFCRTQADLGHRIVAVREGLSGRERLWIAWPKRSSGFASDLGLAGLGCGQVDFKICAIDVTWSGLQFAPRRN